MTYLDRAIKDGYAIITGPENKQKIIYVTSDNHTENYNDPEEKVRAEFWAELIYEYDYPAHRIKVEVTIPDRVPTDRADIVISCPLILNAQRLQPSPLCIFSFLSTK